MTRGIGRDAMVASFGNGAALEVMRLLEEWGVADERWACIPAATFQVSALLRSHNNDERRFILSGKVAYIKVRFKGAGPLAYDAKIYGKLTAIDA